MSRDAAAADDLAGGRAAAILVDFDNVFTRLWERDVELAIRFASDPARWLKALTRSSSGEKRRWLVARCYLNPSGWVSDPGEPGGRLRFYKLRPAFVEAGFEVIDCPPVTRGAKNAADIRIVMDVLDLLDRRTRFDEFVFVSGDSDFTPLLHRLRGEDRLTAIVAPGGLAAAYASVADRVVGFDRLADMLDAADDQADVPARPDSITNGHDVAADQRAFAALVRRKYEEAKTALNLSALSSAVIEALPNAKASEWFGAVTFRRAITGLALPGARFSQHHLWAEGRHSRPTSPDRPGEDPDAPPRPPAT